MAKVSPYITLIAALFFFLFACKNDQEKTDLTDELKMLAVQEKEIHCSLKVLEDSVTRVWDQYNETLATSFPNTSSDYIKEKMLEVRNSGLLRMFQTFDSLDQRAKYKLVEVEEMDASIVTDMKKLEDDLNQLEQKKIQLFVDLEANSESAWKEWRMKYDSILQKPCTLK
jgi:hypothetical protein